MMTAKVKTLQETANPPIRLCKECGKKLWPWYCNQTLHPKCRSVWRRKYLRNYQRILRQEIKDEQRLIDES